MKNTVKQLTSIKNTIALLIIFLFIGGNILIAFIRTKRDACISQHEIIFEALKDHVNSTEEIPKDLSDLASLDYTSIGGKQQFNISDIVLYLKDQRGLNYYPNAWDKPEEIILRSKVFGSYVITFGKGICLARKGWGDYVALLALLLSILLVGVLVVALIAERIVRKKGKKAIV